jgi:two-component system response regulator NreC
MPLTILICDDHALFREGLSALLTRQPEWKVIAEAADGAEAIGLAREHRPDLAVLDVAMPGVGGVEAAEGIRLASPGTRVLAVSMYGDAHYRKRMLAAGARAYVLKNDASAELIAAIQAVVRGETYISPALSAEQPPFGPARSAALDLTALTAREMEVFRHLASGRRNREIAEALGISVKTVETHRARLMLKLGIDNLAELVKVAIRAGVVGIE